MLHRHTITVRYSEVDVQGVVFNAHYLAYCDDAFESWLHVCFDGQLDSRGLIAVVKRTEIEWEKPARIHETIVLTLHTKKLGRTSFAFCFEGAVNGSLVFMATTTYVIAERQTFRPTEIPADLRELIENKGCSSAADSAQSSPPDRIRPLGSTRTQPDCATGIEPLSGPRTQ